MAVVPVVGDLSALDVQQRDQHNNITLFDTARRRWHECCERFKLRGIRAAGLCYQRLPLSWHCRN